MPDPVQAPPRTNGPREHVDGSSCRRGRDAFEASRGRLARRVGQDAPVGQKSQKRFERVNVATAGDALARALEGTRTDAVVLRETAQDRAIDRCDRNARAVQPHQNVPAGTPVAGQRVARVAIRRASRDEIVEQTQALVEFPGMWDEPIVLQETGEPERTGHESAQARGAHLAALSDHARTAAVVTAEAAQHGVVDILRLNAFPDQPSQKMPCGNAKLADPAGGQTLPLQMVQKRFQVPLGRSSPAS